MRSSSTKGWSKSSPPSSAGPRHLNSNTGRSRRSDATQRLVASRALSVESPPSRKGTMAVATSGRFACEACGKSFAWKAALAGKKAKCSCGTVMTVPQAPLAAIAHRTALLQAPIPTAHVAAPAPTLGYVSARKRPSEELPIDKLIDPVRDIYIPTALLTFGFIAILLWALVGRGITAQLSMAVLVASSVSTEIKTTVLVMIAVSYG